MEKIPPALKFPFLQEAFVYQKITSCIKPFSVLAIKMFLFYLFFYEACHVI